MWIERKIASKVRDIQSSRPVLLVTGARQVGKSSLLRKIFNSAEYITLDKVARAEAAEQNPESFLANVSKPVLLDEVQYAPSLFRELKIFVDRDRTSFGNWILTGSQKFNLMREVSDSLAGRVGIVELETLCAQEIRNHSSELPIADLPWRGGYPELWAHSNIGFTEFFESYIQTYLERDLQLIVGVQNLRDFGRFMKSLAIRAGQLLNYASLAKDIGVSQVTIKKWLGALEVSGLVCLLSPYYKNFGKRLIKAPKLYFLDNGLLAHLLDIETKADYERHIYRDHIWENFVFTEIVKSYGLKPNKNLFFYRDQNGVEIDFVLDVRSQVTLVEVKNSEVIDPKKLNFKKVAPLFDQQVECFVACLMKERRAMALQGYTLFNPVYSSMLDL